MTAWCVTELTAVSSLFGSLMGPYLLSSFSMTVTGGTTAEWCRQDVENQIPTWGQPPSGLQAVLALPSGKKDWLHMPSRLKNWLAWEGSFDH